MRVLAFALAALAAVAWGDPPSTVKAYMVSTENPTSYVTFAFSGTNNLKAALRWIDANWPTNINVSEVYAPLSDLEEYVLRTNLFNAGVEDGLLGSEYAGTNYLSGTNISGASYDVANKTWSVTPPSGVLRDWMRLYSGQKFSTNSSGGVVAAQQVTQWSAVGSSGAGRLLYDSGTVRIPSNSVAVVTGTGEVGLHGTNVAFSMMRWLSYVPDLDSVAPFGVMSKLSRKESGGMRNQAYGFSGSVIVATTTNYVDISVWWVYKQTGTSVYNDAMNAEMNHWGIFLYDAGF